MIIFPAIDLFDQKCVRLTQGDYGAQTTYGDDPVSIAQAFEKAGARYLHTVDLNAARTGSIANLEVIKNIAARLSIPVQTGGGIRSREAAQRYFDAGVSRVIVGTAAVTNETLLSDFCKEFPNRFCLSLDVRDDEILIKGWTEGSGVNLFDFFRKIEGMPVAAVVVTDVAKDGMLKGPSFELYARLMEATKLPLIASGGVTSAADVSRIREMGLYGAIVGKALYENKLTLKQIL